jgi:hypothetical protein
MWFLNVVLPVIVEVIMSWIKAPSPEWWK